MQFGFDGGDLGRRGCRPGFLEFLQVANGGEIDYYCDVPDGRGGFEQMSFPGIFNADEGDFCDETLVGEIRAARKHMDMPQKILPFARDGGDSMLFLDLSDEGHGRVLAYIRELPAWTGPRAPAGLMVLAFVWRSRTIEAAVV